MNAPLLLIRLSLLLLLSAFPVAAAEKTASLQLTFPPTIYAVPGVEMNIYYDNIVLTEMPEQYRFEFSCKIGTAERDRRTITPTSSDVGQPPFDR